MCLTWRVSICISHQKWPWVDTWKADLQWQFITTILHLKNVSSFLRLKEKSGEQSPTWWHCNPPQITIDCLELAKKSDFSQLRLERTQKDLSPTDMFWMFFSDSHAILNIPWPWEHLLLLSQFQPKVMFKMRLITCEWQLYLYGAKKATLKVPIKYEKSFAPY